jgi:nitroreductase
MTPYEAIVSKRDTRQFEGGPVPEEALRRILQAGRMAGSARALEPVRFVVITGQEQKERVAACGRSTAHLVAAPLVVAIVLEPEMGVVGAPLTHFRGPFDAGRAGQNMMVAAWAEGIGSCPASLHDGEAAGEALGLPEGYTVANCIAFGYPAAPDGTPERRPRKALEEYVHRERW